MLTGGSRTIYSTWGLTSVCFPGWMCTINMQILQNPSWTQARNYEYDTWYVNRSWSARRAQGITTVYRVALLGSNRNSGDGPMHRCTRRTQLFKEMMRHDKMIRRCAVLSTACSNHQHAHHIIISMQQPSRRIHHYNLIQYIHYRSTGHQLRGAIVNRTKCC